MDTRTPRKLAYGYDPEDLLSEINNCGKVSELRKIADFGCGNGLHAIHLAQAFPEAKVTAIEPDTEFFQSAIANASEAQVQNLELLNINIEQFFSRNVSPEIDLIHCCMVFPFLIQPKEVLTNFLNALSPQGIAVVTTFATPENYQPLMRKAAEEFMRRALPSVIFFPTQSHFAEMLENSGFKILKTAHLPLPYRERNAEWVEYRNKHISKRRTIESEVLRELNIDTDKASPITKIVSFFVSK